MTIAATNFLLKQASWMNTDKQRVLSGAIEKLINDGMEINLEISRKIIKDINR